MSVEKPLTAGELIAALSKLPADTVIYTDEADFDRDTWTSWAIGSVTESGELVAGRIIGGGNLSGDEPDDGIHCDLCDAWHDHCCDCG